MILFLFLLPCACLDFTNNNVLQYFSFFSLPLVVSLAKILISSNYLIFVFRRKLYILFQLISGGPIFLICHPFTFWAQMLHHQVAHWHLSMLSYLRKTHFISLNSSLASYSKHMPCFYADAGEILCRPLSTLL